MENKELIKSLNLLIKSLEVAQKRGAFSFEESSVIYNNINTIVSFFKEEEPKILDTIIE
tara:strand:+ start:1273 stop:1449 length:177 start_codon:yes stop_codon:yes gene_type:complete